MKRRILALITCMAMMLTLMSISVTVQADDANFSGSGTQADPFLISSASDLTTLASLTNTAATASTYADKYYQLTADIDMTGISYKPISYATSQYTAQGARFTGTLDGDGHIIKNITINSNLATYGATGGLIGVLGANGVVKNLGVENMSITTTANSTYMCIGGIAGSLMAGMSVDSCYVKGMTVSATNAGSPCYVGGLVGRTIGNAGTITNSYSTNLAFTVTNDTTHSAGIMGACGNTGYTATNCYTTHAKVEGNTAATNSYLTKSNCYKSDTIADATVANLGAAFQADTNTINGGHPLLAWEKNYAFSGAGTQADPYLITNASDLATLGNLTYASASYAAYVGKYYKLTNDIDMTGISYRPICWGTSMSTPQNGGGAAGRFSGTLDGDGHVIKNVSIPGNYLATYGACAGIIGILGSNGVVKNLGVENMSVTTTANSTYLCIGGIAGSLAANDMVFDRCYVKGMTVSATSAGSPCFVGGIAGRTVGSTGDITNSYTSGLSFTITNDANHAAGIMGSCGNTGYHATNCYTTHAKVEGYTAATNSYLTKTKCYASANLADATVANLGAAYRNDVYGKNNSYPLLAWEVDLAGTLTLTQSGETLTANANVTNKTGASQSVLVVICKYDPTGNYVTGCELKRFTVENGASVADAVQMAVSGTGTYKAFLWESGRLIPLTDFEEI